MNTRMLNFKAIVVGWMALVSCTERGDSKDWREGRAGQRTWQFIAVQKAQLSYPTLLLL